MSEPIKCDGQEYHPGQSFNPIPGDDYSVTYVGMGYDNGTEVLVLRDCMGEFLLPIALAPDNIILSEN